MCAAEAVQRLEGGVVDEVHVQGKAGILALGRAAAPAKATAPAKAAAAPDDASDKAKRLQEYEAKKDRERQRDRKVKRLAQVEGDISKYEARLKELRDILSAEHGGDWQKLHKLVDEEQETDRKLQSLLTEWESLSSELG